MRRNCEPPSACRAPPAEKGPRSRRLPSTTRAPRSSLQPFPRFHDRSAAVRRATATGIEAQILFGVISVILVLVVVHQFGPGRDRAHRLDPDVPPSDDRLAVRITRMV